jgi:hypothetical protein
MIRNIFLLTTGFLGGTVMMALVMQSQAPSITRIGKTGYVYEHVKYPPCPDGNFRKVEIPEKDEVDMLTVICLESLQEFTPEAKKNFEENYIQNIPAGQRMKQPVAEQ